MIEEKFMNRKTFTHLVKEAVLKKKLGYIDAVCYVCEQEGIDPEDVKKFIASPIKEKIRAEGTKLNLLPKDDDVLPFE